MNLDVRRLAEYCEAELDLGTVTPMLDEYSSVPLCAIDAVWSIGVNYKGVENVVKQFCKYFGLRELWPAGTRAPQGQQQSVTDFLKKMEAFGEERGADEVYHNRQRTSPRGGILKSVAVYRFGSVLARSGVEYLDDVPAIFEDEQRAERLRVDISAIPGQGSGLSLTYFAMLTANEHLVKPDRWICRFVSVALHRDVSADTAQALLKNVHAVLLPAYPALTLRLLDHRIWEVARNR